MKRNRFKFVLKFLIMTTTELHTLFTHLISLPAETECVEFKERSKIMILEN